ncbi:cell wall-binding repeat-containing protein [Clostridium sp. OS1-26]|uniref:cell wall-binding repeat-containing protein n=1 Tax=Clostridium sp. OS1-26 TaxID=3070681 RepID=UPI0027E12A12|nr:cell wall-binding repeat-containing protein [Clostridium sp. OS1-26]WML35451.1 cell wall-binding repeat-containing protein [Clostridium sp. OS1-26]
MNNNKFLFVLKSKKLAVLVAAVALSISFSFTKAHAAATAVRFNGIDRYETAAKVCEDGWQGDSNYAVIVNGENFPDALSAAPLAKKYEAPILLTGKEILNPYTSVQLNRLNVKNVFIIGGKGVVSQSIEDALKARGIKVTRIGGADRYETSVLVAQKLGKPSEIALVNGDDFHDGLSIAAIAALKGMPVILTARDYMPSVTKNYFGSNGQVDQVYVVGNSGQVTNSVVSLVPNAKRIGNGDIYGRNTGVIDAFQNEVSTGTLYIASAKDFPDSLVAAALAPKTSSPILYVDSPMSASTINYLRSKIINNIKILGGAGVVDYDTQERISYIPLEVSNVNDITDFIWQGEKYTPRPTIVVTASDGNIKEVPVKWNLSKINTTKPGVYTINGKIEGTDRSVVTTLVVKPLPVKIGDIASTADSRSSFSLPETVTAQMSDGTTNKVPVTWDYGTQDIKTPGVYNFTGTVDHYSKKVKLTLTVNVKTEISSINNIKLRLNDLNSFYSSPYYTQVPANMTDGSTSLVYINWDMSSLVDYPGYSGVYKVSGKVSGYSSNITAILVTGNAQDPTPSDPFSPSTPSSSGGATVSLPEINIMEGDKYTLPAKVKNPATGKDESVTWTTKYIDTNVIDTGNIETSRVEAISFEGKSKDSNMTATVVVNMCPKVMGIDADSLNVTISKSSYYGRTYTLPSQLTAVLSDGTKRNIAVDSWSVPNINISTIKTYKITGKVKLYSSPVTLTVTVTE